jgi:hypothetical protein
MPARATLSLSLGKWEIRVVEEPDEPWVRRLDEEPVSEWSHHGRSGSDGAGVMLGLFVAAAFWFLFFAVILP